MLRTRLLIPLGHHMLRKGHMLLWMQHAGGGWHVLQWLSKVYGATTALPDQQRLERTQDHDDRKIPNDQYQADESKTYQH